MRTLAPALSLLAAATIVTACGVVKPVAREEGLKQARTDITGSRIARELDRTERRAPTAGSVKVMNPGESAGGVSSGDRIRVLSGHGGAR